MKDKKIMKIAEMDENFPEIKGSKISNEDLANNKLLDIEKNKSF